MLHRQNGALDCSDFGGSVSAPTQICRHIIAHLPNDGPAVAVSVQHQAAHSRGQYIGRGMIGYCVIYSGGKYFIIQFNDIPWRRFVFSHTGHAGFHPVIDIIAFPQTFDAPPSATKQPDAFQDSMMGPEFICRTINRNVINAVFMQQRAHCFRIHIRHVGRIC